MNNEENTKKSVISGLFWKFFESVGGDAISFVVSIILARLLLPEAYGEIALVNVFLVIANVFVVYGLGTALVQKKDSDDLDFSSIFYVNLLVSIILYFILFFASPYIANFYHIPHLSIVLKILAIKIPIASILSIQNAYISKYMIFKKNFYASLVAVIISAILGIGMAYMGYGIWALVAQILSATVINYLTLCFIVPWRPKLIFSMERVKPLFDYGWKILVSSLIKTGYNQISNLLIGRLYSAKDLAFYNRGQKYPDLVVNDINTAISSVLFPAIAKHQDDTEKVKSMTRKAMKVSLYTLAPILIGLTAVAEPLISWMLTDKWLPCVPFLRICTIYYLFQPVQTANLQAIRAIGRSDIILNLDIVKRGSGILFILLLMHKGVIALAFAPVLMSIVALIVNIIPNRKLINYSYREQFLDIIPILSISILMGLIMYYLSLKLTVIYDLLNVIICALVGLLVYLLLSFLFKLDSFLYIKDTIIDMRKRK